MAAKCPSPLHPSQDNPDKAKTINHMLHRLSRQHFQYCESQFESLGIGPGQVPILMELGCYGQLSQRDLAEKVRVTPATISGTLKRLEKNGFIVRTSMEDDARVSLVSLSPSGKRLMEEARSVFQAADAMPLTGFDAREQDELEGYIRRMLENVQNGFEEQARREGEKE